MPSIYYKNYKPNPTGTLTCGGSTANSTELIYTYTNATTNLRIYRDQSLVHTIDIDASGSGNGEFTVDGLSPSTSYTYKLIHGNNINEQLLAEVQCTTQAGYSGGGSSYYYDDDYGWQSHWVYLDPAIHPPGYSVTVRTVGLTRVDYYHNDTSRYPYLPPPPSQLPYGLEISAPWGSWPRGWDEGDYTFTVTSGLSTPVWINVSGYGNAFPIWPGYPY